MRFSFSYTSDYQDESFANLTASVRQIVSAAIANALQRETFADGTKLSLKQYNEVKQFALNEVRIVVTANSDTLLNALSTSAITSPDGVLSKIASPTQVTWDVVKNNPELYKGLYEDLRARAQDMKTARQEQEKTGQTFDLGIDLGLGDASTPFHIGTSDKAKLEKETGVSFTEETVSHKWLPSSATLYEFHSLDTASIGNVAVSYTLQQQGTGFSLTDSRESTFRYSALNLAGAQLTVARHYDGVLPGTAFCYLGSILPPGYVALDGSQKWPNSPWIPTGARAGDPIPKMEPGVLVGQAPNPSSVGVVTGPGKASVQQTRRQVFTWNIAQRTIYRWDNPTGIGPDDGRSLGFLPGDPTYNKYFTQVSWDGWAAQDQHWGAGSSGHVYPTLYRMGVHWYGTHEAVATPIDTDLSFINESSAEVNIGSAAAPPYLQCRWIMRMD